MHILKIGPSIPSSTTFSIKFWKTCRDQRSDVVQVYEKTSKFTDAPSLELKIAMPNFPPSLVILLWPCAKRVPYHVRGLCALGWKFIRNPSLHNGLGRVFSQPGAIRVTVLLEAKSCAWVLWIVAAVVLVSLIGKAKLMDPKRVIQVCTQMFRIAQLEDVGRPLSFSVMPLSSRRAEFPEKVLCIWVCNDWESIWSYTIGIIVPIDPKRWLNLRVSLQSDPLKQASISNCDLFSKGSIGSNSMGTFDKLAL